MGFTWLNKLSDYTREYRCDQDCEYNGCPGHLAKFHLSHVTDTFHVEFHNGTVHLDPVQAELLLDFFKRLRAK